MKRRHTPNFAVALLATCLAWHCTNYPCRGQTSAAFPAAGESSEDGLMQALWQPDAREPRAVRFSDYVDAHGEGVVVPAGYFAPQDCTCRDPGRCRCGAGMPGGGNGGPQAGCMTPYGPGVYGNCPPPGTSPPYGCNADMADMAGAGSMGIDQCGPHYFDVRGEFVHITRNHTFDRSIDFMSQGATDANIVLSSDDLSYDYEPAFRVIGRYDVGPLSVAEISYFGLHDMRTEATASVPPIAETVPPIDGLDQLGDLFSLFSNFGIDPADTVVENGSMGTTDRAVQASIALNTDLQTAEASFRRYWVGYSPRVSGTLLIGARYTRLSEQFKFATLAEQGSFDYNVDAENDIVGLQVGGDMTYSLMQGLRFGSEMKAGIYNNRYKIDTVVNDNVANNPSTLLVEHDDGNNISFMSEASLDLILDVSPSWTVRAGYEALWINSVALASNNFNDGSPFGLFGQQPREPFSHEQANVFYHGWHVGAEYIW